MNTVDAINDLQTKVDALVLASELEEGHAAVAGLRTAAKSAKQAAEKDTARLRAFETEAKDLLFRALEGLARDSGPGTPKPDILWVLGSALLVFVAIVGMDYHEAAYAAVVLLNMALVGILVIAALRSNRTYDWAKRCASYLRDSLPSRVAALPVIALLFVTLAVGFAGIYSHLGVADRALYHSVATLTGLGFSDVELLGTLDVPETMMWQLWSSVLLLVCVLALLVNRISDF